MKLTRKATVRALICVLSLVASASAGDAPAAIRQMCDRTPKVRDAILKAICKQCKKVTVDSSATNLSLADGGLTSIQPGDLSGMPLLVHLDLRGNQLQALPETLPVELPYLRTIQIDLASFANVSEQLVSSLEKRPGFKWSVAYPVSRCYLFESGHSKDFDQTPFTLDELKGALHLVANSERIELLRAWKARKGVFLVGIFSENAKVDDFRIVAVTTSAMNKPVVIGQSDPFPADTWGFRFDISFDLAPYRLSGKEAGFGVRRANQIDRLSDQEEELQIFRLHNGKIESVLTTITLSSYPGVDPDSYQDYPDICSVIAVLKSQTNGFNNLIKLTYIDYNSLSNQESHTVDPPTVFRWNGSRYEKTGEPDYTRKRFFPCSYISPGVLMDAGCISEPLPE